MSAFDIISLFKPLEECNSGSRAADHHTDNGDNDFTAITAIRIRAREEEQISIKAQRRRRTGELWGFVSKKGLK